MLKSRVVPVLLLISVLGLPAGLSAQKAVAVFDQFSKLFEDNYAFFQVRGVDWEQQKRTYRSRITDSTSDDELFSIFCQMIKPLGDGHVSVFGNNKGCNAGERLAWESKSGEIQNFIHRKYLISGGASKGAIVFGLIDGATGYVNIQHMAGCQSGGRGSPGQPANELDDALATMKNVQKIIVDLRFNGGGADECALGFASRFADKKRLVYSKETYSRGKFGNREELFISPQGTVNNTAKVIVLTSRATASAAEMMVMAMMALPQATIVGEPTEGIHSDIYSEPLSNGWFVSLSNQKYILPNGKVYEKEGLPPHKPVPFKGDVIEQGRDVMLEQAIAY
jgi:carboxyl-terminal processing protease